MTPSREELWERLKEPLDLLILGGGATGAGVLWEATLRGLRAALVEAGDFGAGTSSRSTKLLHGGVRYLELAVRLIELTGVASVPGSSFHADPALGRRQLRFCFCKRPETLDRAAEGLARLA